MSNTLFNISERYLNILELCNDDTIPQEVFEDALREMDGELNDKLENMVNFIKSLNGDIQTIDNEIARLTTRKNATKNKINSLKNYMENCLKLINTKKVKTSLNTISIQNNPPSIEIVNEDLIPREFRNEEVVVKYNKKAMLSALKNGKNIAGVSIKQTESIRIR